VLLQPPVTTSVKRPEPGIFTTDNHKHGLYPVVFLWFPCTKEVNASARCSTVIETVAVTAHSNICKQL
jgi:hypothetical protein